MQSSKSQGRVIRVGACEWLPEARSLSVRHSAVKLNWRALECWAMLVEAGGETVRREDLQQRLWGGALVEESSLAQVIVALRKAIDPAPSGGSHIETLPRIGYRLAVPVVVIETPPVQEIPTVPPAPPRRAGTQWPPLQSLAGLLAVAGAVALAGWITDENRRTAEAERLTRQAMTLARQGSIPGWQAASERIAEAFALRPGFALAKAANAELAVRSGTSSFEGALSLAREAVAADPSCLDCKAVLGYVLLTRFWRWQEAEQHLLPACQSPDASAMAHVWCSQLFAITRRPRLALEQADRSLAKQKTASAFVMKGLALYMDERLAEAEAQFDAAEGLDPKNSNPPFWRYRCFLIRDQALSAAISWTKHAGVHGGLPGVKVDEMRDSVHRLHRKGGKAALVAHSLNETTELAANREHSYERAVWKAWIGDRAGALDELENAARARPYNLIYVAADPALKLLHHEPRFLAVLRALDLPLPDPPARH